MTTLIQKDSLKGTTPNNYRHITCLPLIWKIQTIQIREEIYDLLTSSRLFSKEQTGCHKESIGIGELLCIDQHILYESKTKWKNLVIAQIDNKKAYDMVPQSWIINCLKMCMRSDEFINFIKKAMKTWKVKLTAGGISLAEANIQNGIFQGGTQSPSLFAIVMLLLKHILRKCTTGWKLSKSQKKINQLMYKDHIKLFAKTE